MNSGKGFDILFLRNVCYDSESSRILLFGNSIDRSELAKYFNRISFLLREHTQSRIVKH